jgi:hypothetical protein
MSCIWCLNVSRLCYAIFVNLECANKEHASCSDVDTDLYKLIMSPQYLTTEHIQVSYESIFTTSLFLA